MNERSFEGVVEFLILREFRFEGSATTIRSEIAASVPVKWSGEHFHGWRDVLELAKEESNRAPELVNDIDKLGLEGFPMTGQTLSFWTSPVHSIKEKVVDAKVVK